MLHGGRAVYLLAVQADGPVAIKVDPQRDAVAQHQRRKVLLASVGDVDARKLLGTGRLTAITPNTITDAGTLIAALAKVRRQGFAVVVEENIRGSLSVGAPIRDRHRKVPAALSVAFPKYLEAAGLTRRASRRW